MARSACRSLVMAPQRLTRSISNSESIALDLRFSCQLKYARARVLNAVRARTARANDAQERRTCVGAAIEFPVEVVTVPAFLSAMSEYANALLDEVVAKLRQSLEVLA